MNYIIYLITFISFKSILLYLQESHYRLSFINIYLKRLLKTKRIFIIFLIVILIILRFVLNIHLVIDFIIVIFMFFLELINFLDKSIIKLKVTKRIIRISIVNIILLTITEIILNYNYSFLLYLFCPLTIWLSVVILIPIEKLINNWYIKKAREKLLAINPLVICISGSAGKTSLKNILNHYLKEKYITFITPKSFNTVMGIALSINKYLKPNTKICIFECGASKVNDIKDILKVLRCDISIITNISNQHLETFKTIENIKNEKYKLAINSLLHIGQSTDYKDILKYSNSYLLVNDIKTIYLKDYQYVKEGMKFNIILNSKVHTFYIPLFGYHNVTNTIIALSCSLLLGLDIEYLKRRSFTIPPVSSRLEHVVYYINKNYYIDIINDSFNSNYSGFLEALEVLKVFDGKHSIITPGIITGGVYIEKNNKEVAKKILEKEIYPILVKSIASRYFKEVFDEYNYSYLEFSSFKEAFNIAIKEFNVILIENDITDIYK